MADASKDTPGPFDVRTIEFLVQLMANNDISELDVMEGTQRIRLRRGARVVAAPVQAAAAAPASAPPPVPALTQAPALPTAPSNLLEIKSPTVGTFYAQEKPEAPPFVTVGSRVTPTTVIGQIEAMKVFNDIVAGISGVVREILVKNADGVEYNQVLFRVDPSA